MNYLKFGLLTTALIFGMTQPALAAPIAVAVGKALIAAGPIGWVVLGVVAFVGIKAMMKAGKRARQAQRSLMVNKQSNSEPIPVVYGRRRIGGVRVFIGTSNGNVQGGGANEYLNIIVAMAEGRTGDLKKLIFNDKIVWDSSNGTYTAISGNGEINGYELTGFETTDPNFGSEIKYAAYHPGHPDQVVDAHMSGSIGADWGTNHKLRGITYVALKLKFNPEVFEGGVPTVTAEWAGKRIQNVANITAGDTSRSLDTVTEDQNPVDVLYDYLVDDIYGKGLDRDVDGNYVAGTDIDIASFQSARSDIAGKIKINGHLDTDNHLYDNIQETLDAFNGILMYVNGKYKLRVKKPNESSVTNIEFDEDNIIGPISVSLQDIKKRINTLQVEYFNRDLATADGDGYEGFNEDTLILPESTDTTRLAYKTEDQGKVLEHRMENNLISDETSLKKLYHSKMDDSRYGMMIQFDAPFTAIKIEAGDIINVSHPQLDFDNKKFRVVQMELGPEGTINIVAVEYISSVEIS